MPSVGAEEFRGFDTSVVKSKKGSGVAQRDENGDRRLKGAWRPRRGLARTGLNDGTSEITGLGWGATKFGRFVVECRADGTVHATAAVVPLWHDVLEHGGIASAPSLTAIVSGTTVHLTITAVDKNAAFANLWRDGVVLASTISTITAGTEIDDTTTSGPHLYAAASVLPNRKETEKAQVYVIVG